MSTDTGYADDVGRRDTYRTTGADLADGAWVGNGVRDRVRWGPIWAGLITAIATFILLTVAAVAIGAQAVDSGAEGESAGMAGGIASALIAPPAFPVRGGVAARAVGGDGR